ncbi:MAG: DUF177 domain-containing protein [Synergistaceae bacterium]
MSEFFEKVPEEWDKSFSCSIVPKDGAEYLTSFLLTVSKPISYWSQIYKIEKDIYVEIKAVKTDNNVLLTISLQTSATLPCFRCLEPATVDVTGTLNYVLTSDKIDEDEEDLDFEVLTIKSWDEKIDLSSLIWEVLVTSLPVRAICSHDCLGLCNHCGANLNNGKCKCEKQNGDPRFDVLRTFIKEK